jgi:hypothetical protein
MPIGRKRNAILYSIILLALLPSCGFVEETNFLINSSLPQGPPWWDTSFSHRMKLTFDNSSQTQDLINFPVLVKLNSSRISYSYTQDNGQDIRFVDSDDTILSHEIELWDEGGNSWVWMKVPQIDGGSSEDYIWMYYGNQSASDGQNGTGVWDSDYLGVWHLSEQAAGTHADSTNNGISGSRNNNTFEPSGKTGGAQSFDGNNDFINFGDVDELDTAGYFTVSLWFNRNSDLASATNHGTNNVLIGQSSGAANDNLELGTDGSLVELYIDSTGADMLVTYDAGIQNSTWYWFSVTYDKDITNELKLYLDGSIINEWNTFGGNLDASSTSPLSSGLARPLSNLWGDYSGIIDELRISLVARSAEWINAQYLSMNDSFISFGTEQTQ